MPANKRQHFVPKHALRRFAVDLEGSQVDLVHLSSGRTIRGASLKKQCYRDWFYGTETEIERNLSLIEGTQSRLVDKIVVTGGLDVFDTGSIVLMVALQRARTVNAEEEVGGAMEGLIKLALHGRIEEEVLRKVRIRPRHGAAYNVRTAIRMSPMIYDLKQILVINRTDTPFVLSDNPVVATNWFCRNRYPDRPGTGTSLAGLQMAMPITPALTLLLLDSGVYSTDAIDCRVEMDRREDVQHFNRLQWMNASSAVYIPPGMADGRLEELVATGRPAGRRFSLERHERRGGLDGREVYARTGKDEYEAPSPGVTSEIVVAGAASLPIDIRFPGMRIRAKPSYYDDGTMASPVRDPAWVDIVRDFDTAMQAGTAKFGDLMDFVAAHRLEPMLGSWRKRVLSRAMRVRE